MAVTHKSGFGEEGEGVGEGGREAAAAAGRRRGDGLKRKWEGLMTETTQEFVQLFYCDGSIIQPLQDK